MKFGKLQPWIATFLIEIFCHIQEFKHDSKNFIDRFSGFKKSTKTKEVTTISLQNSKLEIDGVLFYNSEILVK